MGSSPKNGRCCKDCDFWKADKDFWEKDIHFANCTHPSAFFLPTTDGMVFYDSGENCPLNKNDMEIFNAIKSNSIKPIKIKVR